MEPELEKLLGQKSFGQLSRTEKGYVLDYMTEEEYEQFRVFLKLSRNSSEEAYGKMNPSPMIKNRLKVAFLQSSGKKATPGFSEKNKISRRPVRRMMLTYAPIAALVILAVVLFFEFESSDFAEPNTRTTAMDIDQIENFELLQEQMSLKETGLYSKIIVPEGDVEMSLVRPDTSLKP